MSLVSSLAKDRLKAVMNKISAQHRTAPVQKRKTKKGGVNLEGVVVESYYDEQRGKTAFTILVANPVSCYKANGNINDSSGRKVGQVNLDSQPPTVSIVVQVPANFKQRVGEYQSKGWEVDVPFSSLITLEPFSSIRASFEGNRTDIQQNSFVSFSVTASLWIGECTSSFEDAVQAAAQLPEGKAVEKVRRPMLFKNGQEITQIRETSDTEMVQMFEQNPQLCISGFAEEPDKSAYRLMCEKEDFQPGGMRKYSEAYYFIAAPGNPKSDFAAAFAFTTQEGAGCSVKAFVDETDDKAFCYQLETDPEPKPCARLLFNMFSHSSLADLEKGNTKLFQLQGSVWDTTPYGVSDAKAWPMLAPRLIECDTIFPFRINLAEGAQSAINSHPDSQEARGFFPIRISKPIVALAPLLYKKCLPVSLAFVTNVIESNICFMGSPVVKHQTPDRFLWRNVSEMSKATATAFVHSPQAKKCVFRAMTLADPSVSQEEYIAQYIAGYEQEYKSQNKPALEAALDPNFRGDFDATYNDLYFQSEDELPDACKYDEDHIMWQNNMIPMVTSRDKLAGKMFYMIFALDEQYISEVMQGSGKDIKMLEAPVPKTPVSDKKMLKAPGAPKKRKAEVAAVEAESSDQDEQSAAEGSESSSKRPKLFD